MNVNNVLTKDYENKTLGERGKNKPNSNPKQTQTNPITEKAKMNVSSIITKGYENKPRFQAKAKQTQYKPKQTQSVVSLPALSAVEGSNLFQNSFTLCEPFLLLIFPYPKYNLAVKTRCFATIIPDRSVR